MIDIFCVSVYAYVEPVSNNIWIDYWCLGKTKVCPSQRWTEYLTKKAFRCCIPRLYFRGVGHMGGILQDTLTPNSLPQRYPTPSKYSTPQIPNPWIPYPLPDALPPLRCPTSRIPYPQETWDQWCPPFCKQTHACKTLPSDNFVGEW